MAHHAQLAQRLANSPLPVYLIDGERRIVYGNTALEQWLELPADQLIGKQTAYHGSVEADPVAAGLLGLCPPPSALAGGRLQGTVSCVGRAGGVRHRRADFIPFPTVEENQWEVLVVLQASDMTRQEVAAAMSPAAPADALHRALVEWRETHLARYAQGTLVGISPAIRRTAEQVTAAATAGRHTLITGPAAADLRRVGEAIYGLTPSAQRGELVRIDTAVALPDELRRALAMADQSQGTLLLLDVARFSDSQQQELATRLASPGIKWRVIATLPDQREGLSPLSPLLYHVLATMEIAVPPIAERLEDLPLLAQWQLEHLNRESSKQLEGLTSEAMQHLALYDWPGESAELYEVLAAAHGKAAGPWIQVGDLPPLVRHAVAHARHLRKRVEPIDLDQYLESVEGLLVRRAMELADGNKAEAARLLSLTRPRLYRKLEQLEGGDPPPPRRPPRVAPQPKPATTSPPEPEEPEIEFLPIDSAEDQATP